MNCDGLTFTAGLASRRREVGLRGTRYQGHMFDTGDSEVDIVVDEQWSDNRKVTNHSGAITSTPRLGTDHKTIMIKGYHASLRLFKWQEAPTSDPNYFSPFAISSPPPLSII